MNRYAKDMLARRMRDGRNPYGSAGGYVVRNKPRRDRAMENEDYARGGRDRDMVGRNDYAERNSQSNYNDYAGYDYAGSSRDYEQGGQYGRDSGYGYGVGMFDYDTEDYRRDYGHKLTNKDIRKWEKDLENADGTRGKKWDADQIRQVAQQHSIRFDEYSPELLTAIANMLYSDYCRVLGGDMTTYVKLAKAWLEDDDFEGEPEEKAMLYYKCIVSKDD